MLRKSTHASAGEPSFFYLLIADSCFQRASGTMSPAACDALRNIGREYLMESTEVTSVLEASSSTARSTGWGLGHQLSQGKSVG